MALTQYERNKRWRKNKPEIWNASKHRYYRKSRLTAFNARQQWTLKDCILVIKHHYPDCQTALAIGRSVKAIQVQRVRLKNKLLIN